MFPTYERIEAIFRAIQPIFFMAVAGERGLFDRRKRNAMFLRMGLLNARRAKEQWLASGGDHYHSKKAHEALNRSVMFAMNGSKLDFTPENEGTALIVYALLEACITRPEDSPIADYNDIPGMAEAYLKGQAGTEKGRGYWGESIVSNF